MHTRKWITLLVVAVTGLSLDVITKTAAMRLLEFGRGVNVVGEYFQLMLVYNKGALFGLDPRNLLPWFPVNVFFTVMSLIALGILCYIYYKSTVHDRMLRWGVIAIVPGALGNLSDRVLHPARGVVDFIKIGISERIYWPVFNFADIYVTMGIVMILLSSLRIRDHRASHSDDGSEEIPPNDSHG